MIYNSLSLWFACEHLSCARFLCDTLLRSSTFYHRWAFIAVELTPAAVLSVVEALISGSLRLLSFLPPIMSDFGTDPCQLCHRTDHLAPASSGRSLLGSQGFLLWPTGSISHLVSPREIQEWINQVSQCRSQGCKARKEGSSLHPLVQFHSSIIPVGKTASQQSGWDEQEQNESKEESGRLF